MPKAKHTKHQILMLVTLALTVMPVHAERIACLCCDAFTKLIEITVKKCWEVPAHYAVEGITYKGSYDLAIQAVMTSRVPYSRYDGIDYKAYETDLNIEHTFVYEEHNEKTCQDFQPGQQKLMYYEELGCFLINDKNFNDDTACFYGGHKISDLPFLVDQTLKKYHVSWQESE